mgnify:CR=1 FL=1
MADKKQLYSEMPKKFLKTLEYRRPTDKDGNPVSDKKYKKIIKEIMNASKGRPYISPDSPLYDSTERNELLKLLEKKASGGSVKGRPAKRSAENS